MNEYQPVVFTNSMLSKLCAHTEEQKRNCEREAGKRIRVQETDWYCQTCGGRILKIHPDDFAGLNIDGHLNGLAAIVCASQVLAD